MAEKHKARRRRTDPKNRIRTAIESRMKEKDLNPYKMVERLSGRVSRTSVYRFLTEGGSTSIETIEEFLDELELDLVVVPKERVKT